MSLFSGEAPVLNENTVIAGQKLQNIHFLTVPLSAASTNATLFIAPQAYKVVSVSEVHGVAGGSGAAVNLEVIPSGTANGSGTTNVLTAALALTGSANVVRNGTLGTGVVIPAGSRLGAVLSGTLTGLANGFLQIGVVRV